MGYKVKKRFIGTQQVRPSGWKPGTDTLAYWKLNGNLNDSSGNNRNLTNAGQLTFATVDGIQCAACNGDVYGTGYAYCQSLPTPTVLTVNMRAKATDNRSGEYARGLFHTHFNYTGGNDGVRWEMYSGNEVPNVNVGRGYDYNYANYDGVPYSDLMSRNLRTVVRNNSTHQLKIYRNSVLYNTKTFSSYIPSGSRNSNFAIGVGYTSDNAINRRRYGRISETIVEQKEWTQEEITEYYNFTKSKYIGKKYEYSYTFKGKTTSQIQSDGWSLLTGSLNVNSNGITGSSSQDCRLAKTIPSLFNAKRIIIQYTVVSSGNTNSANSGLIGYGTGRGTSSTGYNMQGSTYIGIYVTCVTNGTAVNGNSVGYITATTYHPTVTIDLENKTIVGAVSGLNNSTLSLNDTQVNDIKNNYNQLIAYVSINYDSISDISIKIEY